MTQENAMSDRPYVATDNPAGWTLEGLCAELRGRGDSVSENAADRLEALVGELQQAWADAAEKESHAERALEAAQAAERERDEAKDKMGKLAQGIADAVQKAGIYNGTEPLDGPSLLMLCDDMAVRILELERGKAAWTGCQAGTADVVRQLERERDEALRALKAIATHNLPKSGHDPKHIVMARIARDTLNGLAQHQPEDGGCTDTVRAEVERLREALEYAKAAIDDAASRGMYPPTLLTENGGRGTEPIIEALAQNQPTPTEAGGRDSVGNADTHESDYERGLEDAAKVVEQHICWHERASEKHWAEVESEARRDLAAAIRTKAQEGRDDG